MFGGIRDPRRMIGQEGFLEAQIRVFNRGAKTQECPMSRADLFYSNSRFLLKD